RQTSAADDLAAVMGTGQAACVKTLRRKLDELSQQRKAAHLGLLLARHWLEVGLVNASYLYIDSHVKVYNGTRRSPRYGIRISGCHCQASCSISSTICAAGHYWWGPKKCAASWPRACRA